MNIAILVGYLRYWILIFFLYTFEAEQDEGLEKLEVTVTSTKHIALAVNEELDLHTRLIVWFNFMFKHKISLYFRR